MGRPARVTKLNDGTGELPPVNVVLDEGVEAVEAPRGEPGALLGGQGGGGEREEEREQQGQAHPRRQGPGKAGVTRETRRPPGRRSAGLMPLAQEPAGSSCSIRSMIAFIRATRAR